MPSDTRTPPTDNTTASDNPCPKTPFDLGPTHSSSDCHEVLVRLRKQAQCLEEILTDIRGEIDELESQEIIDRTREELFETEP